ncbi:MAG: hypothetical protein WC390_10180 [Sulfurimonas sp.]|jgi:hypothetical protein
MIRENVTIVENESVPDEVIGELLTRWGDGSIRDDTYLRVYANERNITPKTWKWLNTKGIYEDDIDIYLLLNVCW